MVCNCHTVCIIYRTRVGHIHIAW